MTSAFCDLWRFRALLTLRQGRTWPAVLCNGNGGQVVSYPVIGL